MRKIQYIIIGQYMILPGDDYGLGLVNAYSYLCRQFDGLFLKVFSDYLFLPWSCRFL